MLEETADIYNSQILPSFLLIFYIDHVLTFIDFKFKHPLMLGNYIFILNPYEKYLVANCSQHWKNKIW